MDRVWREYFPKQPPARAVLGVHRMPTDTPVEINAVAFRDDGVFGEAAAAAVRDHGVADLPSGDSRAECIDRSGNVTTWCVGQRHGIVLLQSAGTDFPINGIDTRGMNPNAQLAGLRLRDRCSFDAQDLGASVFMHSQRSHLLCGLIRAGGPRRQQQESA